jgi:hypothetical protein
MHTQFHYFNTFYFRTNHVEERPFLNIGLYAQVIVNVIS